MARIKRYDGGGRVSDSDDTGTASARADMKSIGEGERWFGRNNSSIRNKIGVRSPDGGVSPLIYIYPEPASKKGSSTVPEMAKGGKVRKSWGG